MGDELGEPTFLLLTALAAGPRHGYALIQRIESAGRLRLRLGSLYGSTARRQRAGAVPEGSA